LVRRFMKIPRRGAPRPPRSEPDDFVAAEDAGRQAEKATALLDRAVGVEWYRDNGTVVDEAALALCRLRRAQAGLKGGPQGGDEAVRRVLDGTSPEAIVWIASRAISFMDESGYPEAVAPWFPDEGPE
jgi:hypothetical protein